MKLISAEILERARKKASQSKCTHHIAALGFNSKGEYIISSTNKYRFSRPGGGLHAEMYLMRQAKRKGITTILVCRVGKSNLFLPIDPCLSCKGKAQELNIRILTIPAEI